MQVILSDFMSLDGIVQAPGGREEDTDGGFAHGGWSMPYFDAEAMGSVIDEVMATTEALLFRMFPDDGQARPLDLVSTTTAGTGVLICAYRPAGH
jgi:hypothetical protein